MFVVSAGMPKSGTGWYYNLTNDLLVATGHRDAREVRDGYQLSHFLRAANCNLRKLDSAKLNRLDEVSREAGTFVVKTHRRPSPTLLQLMTQDRAKVTYIYRDLRDVIVSALERGDVMRSNGTVPRHFVIGPLHSFAKLKTVPGAIRWARWRLLPVWRAYTANPGVLVTRYEDLLADTEGQLARLAEFLGIEVSAEVRAQIVDRYRPAHLKGKPAKGLHLNKGVAHRHKKAMSEQHQALCLQRLPELREMGYVS